MHINNLLESLGLSSYERQTYVALLQYGRSKSAEVAKRSKVSYGRIYEILDRLEQRGLVTAFPTEPKTFDAVDPKRACSMIIKQRQEQLDVLTNSLADLEIPKMIEMTREKDKTMVLQGKQKQLSMISDMHARAKKEILTIPGMYNPSPGRHVATMRALQRGIKIKRLIRGVEQYNEDKLIEASMFKEEVRKNNLLGLRLTVIDNVEALISIVNPDSGDRISIHTTNKHFAKSMVTFFESLWSQSKEVLLAK